jgi:hypothetical protein
MIYSGPYDGVGEYLAKSVMYLVEYERRRDDQPEMARPLFQKGIDLLRKGLDELRGVSQRLQRATSETAAQEPIEEFEGK